MNKRNYYIPIQNAITNFSYRLMRGGVAVISLVAAVFYQGISFATDLSSPIAACIIPQSAPLTPFNRAKIAQCIGWEDNQSDPICHGFYQQMTFSPLADVHELQVTADEASLYQQGRSTLHGHVVVRQTDRIVTANTAYIHRDAKTNKISQIELIGQVRYLEPGRLIVAKKATINPLDKSGTIDEVLYRINTTRVHSALPAWGRARMLERFANKDLYINKATYSTCAPTDNAWAIEAKEIRIDNAKEKGVAKDATLKLSDLPVLYVPYLSFPTSKKRKSGFLMPMVGYSNIGGFDLALPYYLNLAPNYDATITPHEYSKRGTMIGSELRFLTAESRGVISGNFLPQDHALRNYIRENKQGFPVLDDLSTNRWSVLVHENTTFTQNLALNINYQQVSDDYYLQDFGRNLSTITTNQILRQGDLTYTTDHWLMRGMVQSYQTMHPINQSMISDIYERLPQLTANASYKDLPLHANFTMLGEFDYFRWPTINTQIPQGPRYHLDPALSFPFLRPWGYITPTLQVIENYYDVHYINTIGSNNYNRTIPRYSVDSGLYFERYAHWFGEQYKQTLEPRLYYLYVPFNNQTPVPVYESAYMIFIYDQLFRNNRFSGFDRIGDANQLAYALTTRWLSDETGLEKLAMSVGQISYFDNRRVQLCYQQAGNCVDNPLTLGYLSPIAKTSPIASHAMYTINRALKLSGDYNWDTFTHATNNGNLNLHYEPAVNHLVNVGYSYLVNGNIIEMTDEGIQKGALHQASIGLAWPLTERWSGMGVYSYNVSKGYDMMTFLGLQYDSCCWAFRLMGGRVFKNLAPLSLTPQYNTNVYLQFMLKGLGSVANGGPTSTIYSYLPGYQDIFKK